MVKDLRRIRISAALRLKILSVIMVVGLVTTSVNAKKVEDAHYFSFAKVTWHTIAELNKDSKRPLLLQRYYSLSHGLANIKYRIGYKYSFHGVYQGETFGDGETCPDERAKHRADIYRAVTKHSFKILDIDQDGLEDAALFIEEMDCTTEEKSSYRIEIVTDKNGVWWKKIDSTNQENKS